MIKESVTRRAKIKDDTVMVRGLHGEPALKVVWEETAKGAELHTKEKTANYGNKAGSTCTVGFPKEDIFQYDNELFKKLKAAYEEQSSSSNNLELQKLWAEAKPYFGVNL